jgi:hypothetical protein
VTELRFAKDLYRGEAVDAAAKTFARFAVLELAEEPATWIVRVTASRPEREKMIARELANWALGATIRDRASVAVTAPGPIR